MSNVMDYGSNIDAGRTYRPQANIPAFSYVVAGSETGAIALNAAANDAHGKGIVQEDGVANGAGIVVATAGISKCRKAAGAITEDAPLTLSATPGALRVATAGERIYATAEGSYTATEEFCYVRIMPGCGNVTLPGA